MVVTSSSDIVHPVTQNIAPQGSKIVGCLFVNKGEPKFWVSRSKVKIAVTLIYGRVLEAHMFIFYECPHYFSLNSPPGTKILLKMTVGVEHGFLLLNNKNTRSLGGRVEKLAEGWELKRV